MKRTYTRHFLVLFFIAIFAMGTLLSTVQAALYSADAMQTIGYQVELGEGDCSDCPQENPADCAFSLGTCGIGCLAFLTSNPELIPPLFLVTKYPTFFTVVRQLRLKPELFPPKINFIK